MKELRYDIEIRAVRRGQRLFMQRHSWPAMGEAFPIRVLSERLGHCLIAQVPDPRARNASGEYLYFYLGKTLELGERTTLQYERGFREIEARNHWLGMEMDASPQEHLALRVFLPREMRCQAWAREQWSDSSANARCLHQELFDIEGDTDTWAEYEVEPESRSYYCVKWWKAGQEVPLPENP